MLSTHSTSEGWVRYRRCVCGEVSIELVRLGDHTTTVDALATAPGHAEATMPAKGTVAARV